MSIDATLGIKGKADLSPMRREAERTSGSFGAFADKAGSAFLAINQGLELASKAMHAFTQAVDLAKFSVEMDRLEKVISKDLTNTLRRATGNTITSFQAMSVAAKAMAGQFRFTEQELQDVFAVSDMFSHQIAGEDFEAIANRIFDALQRGGRGLEVYGINVEKIKGKANKTVEALRQLHEKTKNPVAVDEASDQFDRYLAAQEEFADKFKRSLGAMVRDILAEMWRLVEAIRDFETAAGVAKRTEDSLAAGRLIQERRALELKIKELEAIRAEGGKAGMDAHFEIIKLRDELAMRGGPLPPPRTPAAPDATHRTFDDDKKRSARKEADLFEETFDTYSKLNAEVSKAVEALQKASDEQAGPKFSDAASPFGVQGIAVSDETVRKNAEAVKRASDMKIEAIFAERDAWLTAGESIIGVMESILGKNKAFTVIAAGIEVAREIAAAASAFARVDIPGGIAHTAAAVKWGIVAIKAGGSAGGTSSSAGAGRGAGRGAGGGFLRPSSSGGGTSNITVYVGEGYVGRPEELGREINYRVDAARRNGTIPPEGNRAVHRGL